MSKAVTRFVVTLTLVVAWSTAPAHAQPASFTGAFTETFNSMGAAGTTPPTGWQILTLTGDSSTFTNLTGNNTTPPNPASGTGGIANGTTVAGGNATTGLTVADSPTGNNVNGYNAGSGADRAIATAPTGIAANVIELQISNNSGRAIGGIRLGYDIRAFQAGADAAGRSPPAGIPEGSEELPGYWLHWSLDNGANFTAVRELIPVGQGPSTPAGQPIVPNSVGTFNVPSTTFGFGPGVNWNVGQTLFLRWIDDNAIDPSPDQIIGLDNISIAPVPEPSSLFCLAAVCLGTCGRSVIRRVRMTR